MAMSVDTPAILLAPELITQKLFASFRLTSDILLEPVSEVVLSFVSPLDASGNFVALFFALAYITRELDMDAAGEAIFLNDCARLFNCLGERLSSDRISDLGRVGLCPHHMAVFRLLACPRVNESLHQVRDYVPACERRDVPGAPEVCEASLFDPSHQRIANFPREVDLFKASADGGDIFTERKDKPDTI